MLSHPFPLVRRKKKIKIKNRVMWWYSGEYFWNNFAKKRIGKKKLNSVIAEYWNMKKSCFVYVHKDRAQFIALGRSRLYCARRVTPGFGARTWCDGPIEGSRKDIFPLASRPFLMGRETVYLHTRPIQIYHSRLKCPRIRPRARITYYYIYIYIHVG